MVQFLNHMILVQKVNQIWYMHIMSTVNYQKHHCPISQALAELGDQWTLLIVRDALIAGPRRFTEFRENLGISRNLLTLRLAQLCETGILERVDIPNSKRHAYEPTQKCRDLQIVILAMAEWAEKWLENPDIHHLEILDKTTGRPVTVEFLQTEDGRIVDPEDIKIVRHGGSLEP